MVDVKFSKSFETFQTCLSGVLADPIIPLIMNYDSPDLDIDAENEKIKNLISRSRITFERTLDHFSDTLAIMDDPNQRLIKASEWIEDAKRNIETDETCSSITQIFLTHYSLSPKNKLEIKEIIGLGASPENNKAITIRLLMPLCPMFENSTNFQLLVKLYEAADSFLDSPGVTNTKKLEFVYWCERLLKSCRGGGDDFLIFPPENYTPVYTDSLAIISEMMEPETGLSTNPIFWDNLISLNTAQLQSHVASSAAKSINVDGDNSNTSIFVGFQKSLLDCSLSKGRETALTMLSLLEGVDDACYNLEKENMGTLGEMFQAIDDLVDMHEDVAEGITTWCILAGVCESMSDDVVSELVRLFTESIDIIINRSEFIKVNVPFLRDSLMEVVTGSSKVEDFVKSGIAVYVELFFKV